VERSHAYGKGLIQPPEREAVAAPHIVALDVGAWLTGSTLCMADHV
jgi:hypothetical protein